jgi:hypothetical protein
MPQSVSLRRGRFLHCNLSVREEDCCPTFRLLYQSHCNFSVREGDRCHNQKSVPNLTAQHCNFSVRKEDRCPNQKSAAKAMAPHADSHCVAQRGVGETTPLYVGRFQGRSGVVLTRNGRRLAGAPKVYIIFYTTSFANQCILPPYRSIAFPPSPCEYILYKHY